MSRAPFARRSLAQVRHASAGATPAFWNKSPSGVESRNDVSPHGNGILARAIGGEAGLIEFPLEFLKLRLTPCDFRRVVGRRRGFHSIQNFECWPG